MRRDDRADARAEQLARGGFLFPANDGYSFDRVPQTALGAIDAAPPQLPQLEADVFANVSLSGVDHVVLVLIDGFGYDAWCRTQPAVPFLDAVAQAGTVTALSTVFPSETAAAIPSLHTGVPPVEHGLLGWYQYVGDLSMTVQALPWTTRSGDPVESAVAAPPEWGETFLDATPIYAGVDATTRVVQPADIVESASGTALTRGVDDHVGAYNATDAAVAVRRALAAADDPSYTLVYLPPVDAIGHRDGPGSDAARAQIESLSAAFERELCGRLGQSVAERTLLVLTADHGQTDTGGDNVDVRGFDPLWTNLATGPDGEQIPPVGSGRNLQLHLQDGTTTAVRNALEGTFDCRTFTRSEYEARAMFGAGAPGDGYARRVPDLVCVHRDRGMWDREEELAHVGMHGGLTRAEMLVPFGAARLDAVRDRIRRSPGDRDATSHGLATGDVADASQQDYNP